MDFESTISAWMNQNVLNNKFYLREKVLGKMKLLLWLHLIMELGCWWMDRISIFFFSHILSYHCSGEKTKQPSSSRATWFPSIEAPLFIGWSIWLEYTWWVNKHGVIFGGFRTGLKLQLCFSCWESHYWVDTQFIAASHLCSALCHMLRHKC